MKASLVLVVLYAICFSAFVFSQYPPGVVQIFDQQPVYGSVSPSRPSAYFYIAIKEALIVPATFLLVTSSAYASVAKQLRASFQKYEPNTNSTCNAPNCMTTFTYNNVVALSYKYVVNQPGVYFVQVFTYHENDTYDFTLEAQLNPMAIIPGIAVGGSFYNTWNNDYYTMSVPPMYSVYSKLVSEMGGGGYDVSATLRINSPASQQPALRLDPYAGVRQTASGSICPSLLLSNESSVVWSALYSTSPGLLYSYEVDLYPAILSIEAEGTHFTRRDTVCCNGWKYYAIEVPSMYTLMNVSLSIYTAGQNVSIAASSTFCPSLGSPYHNTSLQFANMLVNVTQKASPYPPPAAGVMWYVGVYGLASFLNGWQTIYDYTYTLNVILS
eukprot:TRINITY_DN4856_c0_g1_i1.p1 TRINITY_DN4856_c0_g1~~TRINITY_DN4856_c0_g1_i1.p1  ORF type:complete len:392 (+),score=65.58 TRINITY_DN4856_c0_g1_i1:25-1176(+)